MRRKNDIYELFNDMCSIHEHPEDMFDGGMSLATKEIIKVIEKIDNFPDKFSLATYSNDEKVIQYLYSFVSLSEYQKKLIDKLSKNNKNLLLKLNPYVLDPKFEFLTPVIEELVLDEIIQEKLLSLDDYEVSVLKRIVEYTINYGINPSRIIKNIIDAIGCSMVSFENKKEEHMNYVNSVFKVLQYYESINGQLDNKALLNVAYVFINEFYPKTLNEIIHYNITIRDILKEKIDEKNIDVKQLKKEIISLVFSMDIIGAQNFVNRFNINNITKEYYTKPGILELLTLKMLLETKDIDKLKQIAHMLINDTEYEINLFNNILIEDNLLLIYANEFNKCRPTFDDNNLINIKEGIKFYDSGESFYAIVKTLGAFYGEEDSKNYYLDWNDKRYSNHINSVSLIRNDNLAFAEQDGKIHIKLGFLNFDNKMLLGGGTKDIDSGTDSSFMGSQLSSNLYFPDDFIDNTRLWHNELAYERKDMSDAPSEFKKKPDFIILDQEVEDAASLEPNDKKIYDELFLKSIQAAKDFGNIPILIINREKIAKNEIKIINQMLEDYIISHDFNLLLKIIIRFTNNRNGCRGPQHKYIRENYFSNSFYEELLNKIDEHILFEQKEKFKKLVLDEYNKMAECYYDDSTIDMPPAIYKNKRTGQKRLF